MSQRKSAKTGSGKSGTTSYLLNFYHTGEGEGDVVGTVEKLGNEGRHAFHNIEELLHLLGITRAESEEQDHERTT